MAARLLGAALEVPVTSAGSRARPGLPACPAASPGVAHASVRLEVEHVRSASLVLAAAREHRTAAVSLLPTAQNRSFTLLQAARLAAWLTAQGVTAPPGLDPADRLAWWVDELDAARGDAPRGAAADDDLPDPHEGGPRHVVVLPLLDAAVRTLVTTLRPVPALRG
jgi:protein-tyrosine phosphatase